ncbi:hypothetical protein [Streptomyces iconiensis]|uniref:Uncharacterized protein n=1 Tax=Streptomyces iconiensis TaxID=1384038 RepID=A0ABT6ZQ99_9ACTN|nr:hypothetical protein [Streptomyces iconiensis]MDJ1131235.1 hypothetical protein [Streptomyces iconiensis]
MASLIDPVKHAELIRLQRESFARFAALDTFDGDDSERPALREAARQAAAEKDAALYESGLVSEHGYFAASQDLMRAARADDA